MSHQQRGQESSQPGYMDGVCVKISEKYKPPPRINLPVLYSQRLSLNQQIRDNLQSYSFQVEDDAKHCIARIKDVRQATKEKKRDKLDKIKAARKKQMEESSKVNEVPCVCEASTTDILYPTYSHILTPTPLVNNTSHTTTKTNKRTFDIADFEADTSSPFDNMELQTLNDLEELAHVLNTDKTEPTTSYIPQGFQASAPYNNPNGFYYLPNYPSSTVTKISKTLENTQLSNNDDTTRRSVNVDNIFELLPKNLQQLSKHISLMGYPLPRVARACRALGDDQKKVVEHLIIMSELLDLGFAEEEVSSALIQCNNDREMALDILIM